MKFCIVSTLLLAFSFVLQASEKEGSKRKLELELSAAESINGAVSFKFGSTNIYGIVSAGIVRFDNPDNSAVGLGLGTQKNWDKGWTNELELVGYTMNREGDFSGDLSMLTQLKATFGKQFAPHFKVYCGPVLNMSFLQHKEANGKFSNDIAPYSIWKNHKDKLKADAWIGIVGGIRF